MTPRSRADNRQQILGDPKYDSLVAAKFMNALMIDGKKSIAESIFYEAMDIIEEQSSQPGLQVESPPPPGGAFFSPPPARTALGKRGQTP